MFALATIISCVNDDDFETPNLEITDPNPSGEVIGIQALANAYEQAVLAEADDLGIDPANTEAIDQLRGSFRINASEAGQFVQGFVISSDESGNWFEELIIQDAPSEPNAGVRVLIDDSPLFTYHEFGRRIFVKLAGLQVGDSNGVLTLGVTDNLEKIPAPLQFDFITRSPEVATITPTQITIADFSEALENTHVELTDVQFLKEEVDANLTFAGEPLDEFDGERTLVSCDNSQTVILSTSTFANFKSVALPAMRGNIRGTLSRNFFGEEFNFVINDLSDISFDNAERCDPEEIDCGLADNTGSNVLFEDDFEAQATNQPISGNGWTNFAEAGTETWEAYTQGGTNASIGISARVGSFMSGDDSTIAWLITPEIDLAQNTGETLEFLTSNSFSDGSNLEVLFSSNWDGIPENITSATWETLSAATIVQDDDFFGDFIESGTVDLSCIENLGYVAFKYTGNGDEDFDGTYELEGIQINAD